MPWVKLDENCIDHPKIAGLSDGAFRLWIEGLAYCNRHLTDGQIDIKTQAALTFSTGRRRDELIAAGLWEVPVENPSIVRVHDFLEYSRSRAEVLQERASAQARRRRRVARTSGDVRPNVARTSPDVRVYRPDPTCTSSTSTAARAVENSKPLGPNEGTFALYCVIAAEARDTSRTVDQSEAIGNIAEHFKTLCAQRRLDYDSELASRAIEAVCHT